jgi:hypothetical protein
LATLTSGSAESTPTNRPPSNAGCSLGAGMGNSA